MPIHDWGAAPSGLFHHFHQFWTVAICNALNGGLLPDGLYALVEQTAIGLVPDVLTIGPRPHVAAGGGGTVVTRRPQTRFMTRAEPDEYAARANRVSVRSIGGDLVAIVEIISPGNKDSRQALQAVVEKAADMLRHGVYLLIVDLLPPTSRDPSGIHKAIWDEIKDEPFVPPPDKPLILAAYAAGNPTTAYVESVAMGDFLPDMPVFLSPDAHVPLPLEVTYTAAWESCPRPFREAVAGAAR